MSTPAFTTDAVAMHLGITIGADDKTALEAATAAVIAKVSKWHGYSAGEQWQPDHRLGGIMLAAHLFRRRNTPGGVESFSELGPVYVQRSDPHVSMLLGLGAWDGPKVR